MRIRRRRGVRLLISSCGGYIASDWIWEFRSRQDGMENTILYAQQK